MVQIRSNNSLRQSCDIFWVIKRHFWGGENNKWPHMSKLQSRQNEAKSAILGGKGTVKNVISETLPV